MVLLYILHGWCGRPNGKLASSSQDCGISSAWALEIPESCAKPSIRNPLPTLMDLWAERSWRQVDLQHRGYGTGNVLLLNTQRDGWPCSVRMVTCWGAADMHRPVYIIMMVADILVPHRYRWPLLLRKLTLRLAICPLVSIEHLANRRLTSLVKEATGHQQPPC